MNYDNKNSDESNLYYLQKILNKAAPIMSASYSLFFSIILLSWLGYYLDKNLDTFPIIFLLCLFFGMFLGFYQLFKTINAQKK